MSGVIRRKRIRAECFCSVKVGKYQFQREFGSHATITAVWFLQGVAIKTRNKGLCVSRDKFTVKFGSGQTFRRHTAWLLYTPGRTACSITPTPIFAEIVFCTV